jgi:hypothetical protein
MQLTIRGKQLGSKRPLIENQVIEIEDIGTQPTAGQLISAVVVQQVREFNGKPNVFLLLSEEGKIGFGSIYNTAKADPQKAIKTALQAFEDGLFVLFADEQEYTKPSAVIQINENTIITFIRLTFLAGSYW